MRHGYYGVGAVVVSLAAILALPRVGGDYELQLLLSVFLFVTLALGFNFFSGFTGYVNFGYAGFVGLGAYLTAISIWHFDVAWAVGLLLGVLFTALFGAVVGLPMIRVSGAYFAISALALYVGLRALVSVDLLSEYTRGAAGIPFRTEASLVDQYYVGALGMFLMIYLTYRVATSSFGLRLLAIREDEMLAEALGVRTSRENMIAFVVHCAVAGFVGGLIALNLSFIDPASAFNIKYVENPMVMVLLGSLGTVVGPIVGATVFTLLQEVLWVAAPGIYRGILGVSVILIVLLMPEGLIDQLKEWGYLPRRRYF